MTLGPAWTCRDCIALQEFDPFAMCGPHSDYYGAPLAWIEAHMQTGPERAEDTGEGENRG